MFRKLFKAILILLQLCVVGLITAGGAFLWRLHKAPVEVDGIIPYVIHAFAVPESEADIRIGSALLMWGEASHPVKLVVRDFRVADKNGALISAVPELSLSLSLKALLRGTIAPRTLAVYRPSLHLYIGKDGRVRSSKEEKKAKTGETAETDLPLEEVVAYLEKEIYISEFSLINAKIRITDEYHNVEWSVPSADLTYTDKGNRNALSGALTLKTKTSPLTLKLNGGWPKGKTDLALSLRFENIDASRLSITEKYPVLKNLTTPISLETTTHLDMAPFLKTKSLSSLRDTIQRIEFSLEGGAGRLLLPDPVIADYVLESFSAKGALYDKGDRFDVSEFDVRMTDGHAFGNISTQGIGKAIDTKSWESISAVMNATVLNVPVDKLPDYWPATIQTDVHDWVRDNMRDGVIDEGTFALHFIGLKDEASVDCDKVKGTVKVRNTNITYMDGMPEVLDVSGTVHLTRDAVDIDVVSGSTFDVSVKQGRISFYNLERELSDGRLTLELEGSLKDALKILDQPPLDITKDIGIDPEKTSGLATGTLRLDFPLGDAFTSSDQIKVNADAEVSNAAMENIVLDYGLQNVSMALRVRGTDVSVSGTGRFLSSPADFTVRQSFDKNKREKTDIVFNTVLTNEDRARFGEGAKFLTPPSVSGPVKVSLDLKEDRQASAVVNGAFDLTDADLYLRPVGWIKPAGTKGSGSIRLLLHKNELTDVPFFEMSDVLGNSAQGNMKFGEKAELREVELSSLKTGRTDAKARFRFGTDEMKIDIAGPSLDLSSIVSSPTVTDENEASDTDEDSETSLTLNAAVDTIWLSEKGYTKNNALFAVRKKSTWEQIKTIGLVGEQSIPLNFTLFPAGNGRDYKYLLTSEDAGGSLAALDYISSVKGGRLRAEGTHVPGNGSKGTLHVSEFRMTEMPVLSRILMLTSFTGIVDLFKGEGLVFDSAEIPYSVSDSAVSVSDGVVAGPSLGVTLNGKYYRDTGYLNLRGSLIPFYTLNSFLGKIPVIGKIFAGEKGGGLIAPTYTVKGKLPSPHVSVNAFSALAPGAVRELVDKITASDEDLSKHAKPVSKTVSPSAPAESGNGGAKGAPEPKTEELPPPLQKEVSPPEETDAEKVLTDSLHHRF